MAMVFTTISCTKASMFNRKSQFTIKVDKNKAFGKSCLSATFNITSGNIGECLERCLANCRCQSFQICENTKCQLCSSHKEEENSLLYAQVNCTYATYEMRHSTAISQVISDWWMQLSISYRLLSLFRNFEDKFARNYNNKATKTYIHYPLISTNIYTLIS